MRVYGRTPANEHGVRSWAVVETALDGDNSAVYVTALAQCIQLNINESPFWANWGIPSQQSVITQVIPDYWVALMQQRFAQYFASLTITRLQGAANPTYEVNILTFSGASYSFPVGWPT